VFKEHNPQDQNPGFDWKAEDKNVEDESFTYSLHRYLYHDYQLPEEYTPTKGFVDPSGYDPWTQIHSMKKTPIETFEENLSLKSQNKIQSSTVNYNLVKFYNSKKTGSYYYIEFLEADEEFGKHVRGSRSKGQWGSETFKAGMEELGWTYDRRKTMHGKRFQVLFRKDFNEIQSDGCSDDENGMTEIHPDNDIQ
jgi:hypothetical protein